MGRGSGPDRASSLSTQCEGNVEYHPQPDYSASIITNRIDWILGDPDLEPTGRTMWVALTSGPDGAEISKECAPITGDYAATLAYFVANQADYVDVVTYDNVIQVEFDMDQPATPNE